MRSPGPARRSGSESGRTRLRRDSRRGVRESEWGNPAPPLIRDAPARSPGPPFGLRHRKAAKTVARGASVVDDEAIAVWVFDGQAKAQSPTKTGLTGAAVVASVHYDGVRYLVGGPGRSGAGSAAVGMMSCPCP